MKQLIILRGVMGAGKSTFVNNHGLEPYTLSADTIRTAYGAPVGKPNGGYGVFAGKDGDVWSFLLERLEERMERGDFTVIDAVHADTKAFTEYKKLAKTYGYRIFVVDFSHISLETALEQNKKRPEHKHVPEFVIKGAHARIQRAKLANRLTQLKPFEFDEVVKWRVTDLTGKYAIIQVFGDIHGSLQVLEEAIPEIKEDTKYIFCGDWLDRGTDHVGTFRFLQSIAGKSNVTLLMGNHDKHLANAGLGKEVRSNTFNQTTFKELTEAGITLSEIKSVMRTFSQAFYFSFHGKDYLATHGGVHPKHLANLNKLSTDTLINGVGDYSTNIDEIWDEYSKEQGLTTVQLHGHRNMYHLPMDAYELSINLEGRVEHGGHLRYVNINEEGVTNHEVKNTAVVYREDTSDREDKDLTVAEYMELVEGNKFINVHPVNDRIVSVNFTRTAFRKGKWTDMVTKARGLFVDIEDNTIVARSYDKFFNDNERSFTRQHALEGTMKFPVHIYDKETGFLGIISYDKKAEDFFYASKSRGADGNSPHADKVREFAGKYLTNEAREFIKENPDYSFIFEVEDPVFDPHIIEYKEERLVLLDIVHNTTKQELKPYDLLLRISNTKGFTIKKKRATFNTWREYYTWYVNTTDPSNDEAIEGFVVQDATGFQFKIKSPYYNLWKGLRPQIAPHQKIGVGFLEKRTLKRFSPQAYEFLYWLNEQEPFEEQKNIIELRNLYHKSVDTDK